MSTQSFFADFVWRGDESASTNCRFEVSNGVIVSVLDDSTAQSGDTRISGVVLPGLVNAHSHAFHRALRGLTHSGAGDFWSWRTLMYQIANSLTPESYGELAAMVYAEMALAGITGVGEFHYLHHDAQGVRYKNPNEMGVALVAAAQRAGTRLALLDVAYLHGGLDKPELLPEQKRFADKDIDAWLDRVELLGEGGEGWTVGLAPHSVRAVHSNELDAIVASRFGRVVHLHVSEQPAENEACLAATGRTPTAVLESVGVLGPHVTAVHATHLTRADIAMLGSSKTNVCFCPTTERDLADGVGPAQQLVAAGAVLSLGSDSHAVIDIFEEARAVELNQRLVTGRRGLHKAGSLLAAATHGGSHSLGWAGEETVAGINPGMPADFIALSLNSVRLASFSAQQAAAHIVYCAAPSDVTDVWVAGRQIVAAGKHNAIGDVAASLRSAIAAVVTI